MEKKKNKKDEEFRMKSDARIKAEVKRDLKKLLDGIKGQPSTPETPINKIRSETSFDKIHKKEEETLQADIERIQNMTDQEKIDWLCEKHNSFVSVVRFVTNKDFLSGDTYIDRYLIIDYMHQLLVLLSTYNFTFNPKMVEMLLKKNECDLLSILNCLNYI
jgi:hypothetical protein